MFPATSRSFSNRSWTNVSYVLTATIAVVLATNTDQGQMFLMFPATSHSFTNNAMQIMDKCSWLQAVVLAINRDKGQKFLSQIFLNLWLNAVQI
jgi:hypothetical protein